VYYFLIAQLPYLRYEQPSTINVADFKELCRQYVAKPHRALLEQCVCGVPEDGATQKPAASAFINNWRKRELDLALRIARLRAAKLKRKDAQTADETEGWDPELQNFAKAAVAIENPLEAELFLDKGRWDYIEKLNQNTYFGVNAVYAYMLKLLLIERRTAFRAEDGFAEYKTLYASIMENAPGVGATGDS
jgi:hypothetical protein